jgi:hypothetical protein
MNREQIGLVEQHRTPTTTHLFTVSFEVSQRVVGGWEVEKGIK